MASKLEALKSTVEMVLGEKLVHCCIMANELTIVCNHDNLINVATELRDHPDLAFEQCVDLAGIDYSVWKGLPADGPRFAVVLHLLSLKHNWRLRVRVFAPNDDFPVLPSTVTVWNSNNWYEREAFDLFGIVFDGHPDLRRILTDYGFIGHPFRKDFPLTGYVEMCYDAVEQRVSYQPITIEPRETTPRIVREETYGG